MLVYSYTFAPGTPQAWTDRISGSASSLERATRIVLDEMGLRTGEDLRGTFHLGVPSRGDRTSLIPFSWDLPDLRGRLAGELRLSQAGPAMTQISLRASYPTDESTEAGFALIEYAAKAFVDQIPLASGLGLPSASSSLAPIVVPGRPAETGA